MIRVGVFGAGGRMGATVCAAVLEALKGSLAGRHSIRVNDQYRITFRFGAGHAWEVRCEDHQS